MGDTAFGRWLDAFDAPERTVCTVNRTEPDAVQGLLEEVFAEQPVDLADVSLPDADDDLVVVLENGKVAAVSPLAAVMDAVLLTNSDAYRTSDVGVAPDDVPDVLPALDETLFEVRGYPASNKEKLLLTVLSRYVEGRALAAGDGTLRTLFQRLSRVDDERGTRQVYERLAAAGVDVHLYGVPDWSPPADLDVTVHGGTTEEYRESWCVVFEPADGDGDAPTESPAALVAERHGGTNYWRGALTLDPTVVEEIAGYVATL